MGDFHQEGPFCPRQGAQSLTLAWTSWDIEVKAYYTCESSGLEFGRGSRGLSQALLWTIETVSEKLPYSQFLLSSLACLLSSSIRVGNTKRILICFAQSGCLCVTSTGLLSGVRLTRCWYLWFMQGSLASKQKMRKQFVKAMSTACEACDLPFASSCCEGPFYWDYNMSCMPVSDLPQPIKTKSWQRLVRGFFIASMVHRHVLQDDIPPISDYTSASEAITQRLYSPIVS